MAEKEKVSENKKQNKVVAVFKGIAKFFRDCKGEIKKIVWPTPTHVFKNTGIVLVVITIVGLFVFALDTAFMNLLSLVMAIAK